MWRLEDMFFPCWCTRDNISGCLQSHTIIQSCVTIDCAGEKDKRNLEWIVRVEASFGFLRNCGCNTFMPQRAWRCIPRVEPLGEQLNSGLNFHAIQIIMFHARLHTTEPLARVVVERKSARKSEERRADDDSPRYFASKNSRGGEYCWKRGWRLLFSPMKVYVCWLFLGMCIWRRDSRMQGLHADKDEEGERVVARFD